jgi:hypothetical protein
MIDACACRARKCHFPTGKLGDAADDPLSELKSFVAKAVDEIMPEESPLLLLPGIKWTRTGRS